MDEFERRKSMLMLAVLYQRTGEDGECGDDLKVGGAYSFRRRGTMTATSIVMQSTWQPNRTTDLRRRLCCNHMVPMRVVRSFGSSLRDL